jgi:3-hydroxybutyryl-CoA dehydrogenase
MKTADFKRITIMGESPLVEEYASLCHSKGLEVSIRLNPGFSHVRLPRGIRKIAKPTRAAPLALELTNLSLENKRSNLRALDAALPPAVAIITSSVTISVAEQATWVSRPERLIGIGAMPTLLGGELLELAPGPATESATVQRATAFAARIGKESAIIRDTVGMVLPRIICMLTNEACFALMENVASGRDMDMAMKLGTNYPWGPLEWADRIGVRQVLAVVDALHRHFGDDRYRPAPLLRTSSFRNWILNSR